jgi:hypothetical protein
MKMKIAGYRVPSLLYVAAMVGAFAAGTTVLGQTPANSNYDGSYRGTYSGTFGDDSATGSVAFSVAKGAMTVTDPGQGTGTVDSSGAATFSGSLGVAKVDCKFVGSFQPTGDPKGVHASGSWTCAGMGQTGKGTWSADRQ